jgi:putative oxidoreductase
MTTRQPSRPHSADVLAGILSAQPGAVAIDLALVVIRIVLAWIFIYYGAGKLFGAFNGPGIHNTALFFADTAHLRPGMFFAVLGGVIEFGGGVAVALGLGSRLAGLALFGDQVMAMITVTWAYGIGSLTKGGYEFNLTLTVLALAIVALGSGRLSVDNMIGIGLRRDRSRLNTSSPSFSPTSADTSRQAEPVGSTKRSGDGD